MIAEPGTPPACASVLLFWVGIGSQWGRGSSVDRDPAAENGGEEWRAGVGGGCDFVWGSHDDVNARKTIGRELFGSALMESGVSLYLGNYQQVHVAGVLLH